MHLAVNHRASAGFHMTAVIASEKFAIVVVTIAMIAELLSCDDIKTRALWCKQQILSCWFVMIFWLLVCIIALWSTLKARPHYDRGPLTCIIARRSSTLKARSQYDRGPLASIITRWSTLEARPQYERGPRKPSFIFTVRPSVHTNPSRKRSYTETLSKLEEFENAGFSFSRGRKTFSKRSFSKTMTSR